MTQKPKIDPTESQKGKIYLWLAILIFGAASAVVAKLVMIGESAHLDGRNPIAFCNLLFAGNVVAGVTLLAIFHSDWKLSKLKELTPKQWLIQLVLAGTSGALAPSLMFRAIEQTSVTNIVLIETIEIPLGLFLAWLLFREKSSWSAVIGALLALIGVATTLWLEMGQPGEMMQQGQMRGGIGRGEIYAITGTFLLVLGAELGRKQLQSIPLGVFSVFRNVVGSIIFFFFVLIMLGPGHFMDLFRPVLWGWMLLYGGIIVVGGQLSWFSGIKRVTPADISLASAFSPIAGVIFAYLILREIPMTAQIIGGAVILCGIGVGVAGDLKFPHREAKRTRVRQIRRQTQGVYRRLEPRSSRRHKQTMTNSKNPKYRVGVIGCGRAGTGRARAFDLHPLCEVVAIADTDPENLALGRRHFNVPGYNSFRRDVQARTDRYRNARLAGKAQR